MLGSKRGYPTPKTRTDMDAVRLKKRVPKSEDPHGNLILDVCVWGEGGGDYMGGGPPPPSP